MAAVLDVPDSPTRSTGLFIFTICSRIQLVLVVSMVGTIVKIMDEVVKMVGECFCAQRFKSIWMHRGHLLCPPSQRMHVYLGYQQTSFQGCGYIW